MGNSSFNGANFSRPPLDDLGGKTIEREDHEIKRDQYGLLFQVADCQGKGRVTRSDWAYFENLLNKPDAEYEIVSPKNEVPAGCMT